MLMRMDSSCSLFHWAPTRTDAITTSRRRIKIRHLPARGLEPASYGVAWLLMSGVSRTQRYVRRSLLTPDSSHSISMDSPSRCLECQATTILFLDLACPRMGYPNDLSCDRNAHHRRLLSPRKGLRTQREERLPDMARLAYGFRVSWSVATNHDDIVLYMALPSRVAQEQKEADLIQQQRGAKRHWRTWTDSRLLVFCSV